MTDFDVSKDGWRLIVKGDEIEQGNRHYKGRHGYLIELENDGKAIYGKNAFHILLTPLFAQGTKVDSMWMLKCMNYSTSTPREELCSSWTKSASKETISLHTLYTNAAKQWAMEKSASNFLQKDTKSAFQITTTVFSSTSP